MSAPAAGALLTARSAPDPGPGHPVDAASEARSEQDEAWDACTRWEGTGADRRGETTLRLGGLRCAACVGLIEAQLAGLPGVERVQASAASERAKVRWDPALTRPEAWQAALKRSGYQAVPDEPASARALRRQESRLQLWRLFVAGFCSMQVMMFATPSYVSGPGELDASMASLLNWGGWICSLPVVFFSAGPFFRGAWAALRQGRLSMDTPVALGLLVAFVASTGATFDPGGLFGHEVWFDSLTMFVAFLLGARWLEMRARHRAAERVEGILSGQPEQAWRVEADGRVVQVPARSLRPGDVASVPLGAAFPADGVLLAGDTAVDEALLTGEPTPRPRGVGDAVVAGSLNVLAPVQMRVDRTGADTRLSAIVALMHEALTQRPASVRRIDRWAAPFLVAVLAAAVLAGWGWWLVDPSRALAVVVAVLVVTCPCALSLAAPSTLLAATGALAQRGVLMQRLDALETLPDVRELFIDKTGTLTDAVPTLQAVRPVGDDAREGTRGFTVSDLHHVARALASWSAHPLSQAVLAGAPPQPRPASLPAWQAVAEHPGCGLQGRDAAGHSWQLGSARWILGTEPAAQDAAALWLARDGRPLAVFEMGERLRDGAAAALRALKQQGWSVTLLSGDHSARAAAMAAASGADRWVASASPEHKLAAVQAARASGRPVLVVGDGVNDAPVLAAADVSVAMGQGALAARRHADAVIVSDRLSGLADLVHVAERTRRITGQNLAWAAAYNAACVPLAIAGWVPPWAAGLGMALSSLLVVANAARVGRVGQASR